jgi:hypothetical protein
VGWSGGSSNPKTLILSCIIFLLRIYPCPSEPRELSSPSSSVSRRSPHRRPETDGKVFDRITGHKQGGRPGRHQGSGMQDRKGRIGCHYADLAYGQHGSCCQECATAQLLGTRGRNKQSVIRESKGWILQTINHGGGRLFAKYVIHVASRSRLYVRHPTAYI